MIPALMECMLFLVSLKIVLLFSPLFLEEKKKKKRKTKQAKKIVRDEFGTENDSLERILRGELVWLFCIPSFREKNTVNHTFLYSDFYYKLFTYIKFSGSIKQCIEEKCLFQIYLKQHNKQGHQKTVHTELHTPRQSLLSY